MKKFLTVFLKYPKIFIAFSALLVLVFILPFSNTQVDNSLSVLLEKGNLQDQINKNIKNDFGNIDEIVVLAYRSDDLFSYEELNFIKTIQADLENISGVDTCYSIVNITHFYTEQEGDELTSSAHPFLQEVPKDSSELARLKKVALNNPLYLKNLISQDGNVAGFNIVFEEDLSSVQKEQVVRDIIKQYKSYKKNDRFYLTGMHVFMEAAGRFIEKDILLFTSLLVVAMFFVLLFLYRSALVSIAILLTTGICNLMTLGTISLLGYKISIATTSVPAIVTALCMAYTIHIFCSEDTMMPEVLVSNFLAAITSMLGFSSMIFNPMPTVNQLGLYLVIGSFYSLLTTMMFAAPVKSLFFQKIKGNDLVNRYSDWLYGFVKNKKKTIYLFSGLLFLNGFCLFNMKLDTNYYKYFKEKVGIVKSVDFVNEKLAGQYPLVITLSSDKMIRSDRNIEYLKRFEEYLYSLRGVDKVISYKTLLDEGIKGLDMDFSPVWYRDARSIEEVAMLVESEDEELVRYYLSSDEQKSLVFIRTNVIGSKQFKDIELNVRKYLIDNPLNDVKFAIGGTYLNTVDSADKMSSSQLKSSFWAISAILIVVVLFVRSFKMTIFAGLANLLPIFAIYGIMGLFRESLNMGTAIIASISFGLAVDDTIHFLTRFCYAYQRDADIDRSIRTVFDGGVKSITFTSIVLGVGFLTLAFSSFVPVFQLGIYASLTMLLCFLIDVLLLPRLLYDHY